MLRPALRAASFAALVLTLAACSATVPTGPVVDPVEPEAPAHPPYETFDPAEYDAQPPARVEVVHDVPASVMAGRVDVPQAQPSAPSSEPRPRQVDGYRIQVFSSASKPSADRIGNEVHDWWTSVQDQPGAPASLEIVVPYLQPYYRVRVGAFEFREDADDALTFVRRRYPEAFIVPDRVTVID